MRSFGIYVLVLVVWAIVSIPVILLGVPWLGLNDAGAAIAGVSWGLVGVVLAVYISDPRGH